MGIIKNISITKQMFGIMNLLENKCKKKGEKNAFNMQLVLKK